MRTGRNGEGYLAILCEDREAGTSQTEASQMGGGGGGFRGQSIRLINP